MSRGGEKARGSERRKRVKRGEREKKNENFRLHFLSASSRKREARGPVSSKERERATLPFSLPQFYDARRVAAAPHRRCRSRRCSFEEGVQQQRPSPPQPLPLSIAAADCSTSCFATADDDLDLNLHARLCRLRRLCLSRAGLDHLLRGDRCGGLRLRCARHAASEQAGEIDFVFASFSFLLSLSSLLTLQLFFFFFFLSSF